MNSSPNRIQKTIDDSPVETDAHLLNQRLHYLIQVIQQLSLARDLTAIMAAVRTGARKLTNADGATFVLRQGDQCYYADEDAISPLWKGKRFPLSACISGWVMLNQQSVVIADIYTDARIPAEAYRPTFVNSLAMVPIRTQDPLGAIGNYWATHHIPSPDELALLQTLADAAAVALENVHLYQRQEEQIQERTVQLQKALDFEALLKRITDKVRDSLDERQILATVVEELTHGLALNACRTTLYNREPATNLGCDEYVQSHLTMGGDDTQSRAAGVQVYPQLLQPEICQFCEWFSNPPTLETRQLVLICPIVDDQNVLGHMRLYRSAENLFEAQEVRLIQQVANQCAIALRQARLHQATQEQVQVLERLHQLKDDFLSTVSHELRTPISSIRMAIQMLEIVLGVATLDTQDRSLNDFTISWANVSRARGYLQIMSQECQREITLINNLLDLTQLETGMPPGLGQEIVLQTWIPQLVAPFRERMQQQRQQFLLQIPVPLPPFQTHPEILARILTELVQNACKYTPSGETITVAVEMAETRLATGTLSDARPEVLIRISNSGVEISEGDCAHIFDTFYRIPSHDPWRTGGTGLGLALVNRLVKQLSGSIEVFSCHGVTCFTLKLPPVL